MDSREEERSPPQVAARVPPAMSRRSCAGFVRAIDAAERTGMPMADEPLREDAAHALPWLAGVA